MPPKEKKYVFNIIRPNISDSSLNYVPEDAIEGYQERIEKCVEWNLTGSAIRYYIEKCLKADRPKISFSKALEGKIKKSILNGFLDENYTMSFEDQWEAILPMTLWDNSKTSAEEDKICFKSANNITDNMLTMIKKAVKANDRKLLKKDLKAVQVLRVCDCKMTHLDEGLLEYPNLTTLSLCGNFIENIETCFLPKGLRALELCSNRITNLDSLADLPSGMYYVGLARNFLTSDGIAALSQFPGQLTVLDLSDNDIYDLEPLLNALVSLQNLTSLQLHGNPCSVSIGYAKTTLSTLQRLKWLDNRKVLPTDRSKPDEPFESHPDDLRSSYFYFTILRIMSAPSPPKAEKGAISAFFVELELPLLDPIRRGFLMYRRFESLEELLPGPEDEDEFTSPKNTESNSNKSSKLTEVTEATSEDTDIFAHLEPKNSRLLQHYKIYESAKVAWNKIMNFPEPVLRIFCPDLTALRNTFRSTITLRLKYSMTYPAKKQDKKSTIFLSKASTGEHLVTIATIKCTLQNVDWSQTFQHFHWDDSLGTDEAIHWGDGDLSILQYQQVAARPVKGKESESKIDKPIIPENLTCHFSFGIETLH